MKGRITCPKCKNEFILDIPEDEKKHKVTCPKCKNKFTIQAKCKDSDSKDECSWEEHGEPRKTILSKIKPKTNKPTIAAILLTCTFVIGVTTAVFSEAFVESTLDIASAVGLKGDVEFTVTDMLNNSIKNVSIIVNNVSGFTDEKGSLVLKNIKPGVQTVKISSNGYISQRREILVIPFVKSEQGIKMKNGTGEEKLVKFNSIGCSLIIGVFSVFALLSIIACLKRQHLDIALAGAFISIFTCGFFFTSSILSIIAFAIIMMSRDEFEDGKKGKIF